MLCFSFAVARRSCCQKTDLGFELRGFKAAVGSPEGCREPEGAQGEAEGREGMGGKWDGMGVGMGMGGEEMGWDGDEMGWDGDGWGGNGDGMGVGMGT